MRHLAQDILLIPLQYTGACATMYFHLDLLTHILFFVFPFSKHTMKIHLTDSNVSQGVYLQLHEHTYHQTHKRCVSGAHFTKRS